MTTDDSVCMLSLWPGHVGIRCPMCAGSLVSLISAPVLSNRCWLGPGWSLPLSHQTRPDSPSSKTSMKLSEILSASGQIYCRKSLVPSLFSNLSKLYMTEFSPQVTPQFFSISKTNTKKKNFGIGMCLFPFSMNRHRRLNHWKKE